MPKAVTLAARVDADLDAELTRLAVATGRTKSWLINEALRSYVANEQQFLAAVEEGKQALREGRVVDHETVVNAFDRLFATGA
ncbi:CopG family ribbon-helix-helix protein [Rhodopila sp.]|uniref:CopG family ribbon-helix-helix protein n=1 Tax=Rhodopila sp. TaxID=2480087 RepID=UPI003D0F0E34